MAIEILPLQMVCEMARNIPCSPWLLPKLVNLLKSEKATASEIEALIRKDPGLSTAVLRLANSAYFSASAKCDELSEALIRLGNKEVYRIAASTIAGRWLANDVKGYGWEPGDLCKHSLCVAVATEMLAKETGQVQTELAYTAGLLHDVGKLALAHACTDQFEQARQYQLQKQCSWREAEKAIFGYDHTDVGGVLLEKWSFPVNLIQVACFYPRPNLAAQEHQALVVHVHAGKHMALAIGVGVGEEGYSTELDEAILQKHGFTNELMEKMLPPILIAAEKMINAMLKDGRVSL